MIEVGSRRSRLVRGGRNQNVWKKSRTGLRSGMNFQFSNCLKIWIFGLDWTSLFHIVLRSYLGRVGLVKVGLRSYVQRIERMGRTQSEPQNIDKGVPFYPTHPTQYRSNGDTIQFYTIQSRLNYDLSVLGATKFFVLFVPTPTYTRSIRSFPDLNQY
jgi:hypothetical protein